MGRARTLLALVAGLALTACQSVETRQNTSLVRYLYPEGTEAAPARDVQLKVPLRVGVAFVPGRGRTVTGDSGFTSWSTPTDHFSEQRRQALLESIAESFRGEEAIGHVEVIPSTYLDESGGFQALDKLRTLFNTDVIALVSYDQSQISEVNALSFTYFTVVGAFFIEGQDNETTTVLEAVVLDIPSRTVLFRAAGDSIVEGGSNLVKERQEMRKASEAGFEAAATRLVQKLHAELANFSGHAATGTVRGLDTPAITVNWPEAPAGGGGGAGFGGGGALGPFEACLAGLLVALAALRRRGLAS